MHPIVFTDAEKLEYKSLYESGASTRNLAKRKGCSAPIITNVLRELGTTIRPGGRRFLNFSDETKLEIASRYLAGEDSYALGDAYGVSNTTITNILEALHVERRDSNQAARKYFPDETVFDTVTEQSAYVVGFLMADGYISDENKIEVGVSECDRHILEDIIAFFRCDCPISARPSKTSICNGKTYVSKPICRFSFQSRPLCEKLAGFGVVPRKTHIAKVIGLENDRHFWRGLVDGDGEVSISPRWSRSQANYPVLGLVGSQTITNQFADYASVILNGRRPTVRQAVGVWAVRLHGRYAVRMAKHLYTDCTIALQRKHEHALQMMSMFRKYL